MEEEEKVGIFVNVSGNWNPEGYENGSEER